MSEFKYRRTTCDHCGETVEQLETLATSVDPGRLAGWWYITQLPRRALENAVEQTFCSGKCAIAHISSREGG